MTFGRSLTVAVLFVMVAPVFADGDRLLPRFEVGAANHYISRSVIRHEIKADLLETDETVVVRSDAGMSLVVASVDSNGTVELVWTQHYLALTTDGIIPGMNAAIDYDSRAPATSSSPLRPTLSEWIAKPIRIRVDAQGAVLSFVGPAMGKSADPVAQLAQSFFSRAAFEQLPLLITVGAPNPARVRDTWTQRQRVELPMVAAALEMVRHFTYQRKRPRRQTARLMMQGEITSAATGSGAAGAMALPLGAAMTVEEGTMSGAYEWDFAHGRLLSGETKLDLVTHIDTRVGKMTLAQHLTGSIDLVKPGEFERRARSPLRAKGRRSTKSRPDKGKAR